MDFQFSFQTVEDDNRLPPTYFSYQLFLLILLFTAAQYLGPWRIIFVEGAVTSTDEDI